MPCEHVHTTCLTSFAGCNECLGLVLPCASPPATKFHNTLYDTVVHCRLHVDEPSTSQQPWGIKGFKTQHSRGTWWSHPLARGAAATAAAVALLTGVSFGPTHPVSLLPPAHATTATMQTYNPASSSVTPAPAPADSSAAQHSTHIADTASEVEDRLLEAFRQMDARVGRAMGGAALPWAPGAAQLSAEDAARVRATAETLIREVWEVVSGRVWL